MHQQVRASRAGKWEAGRRQPAMSGLSCEAALVLAAGRVFLTVFLVILVLGVCSYPSRTSARATS